MEGGATREISVSVPLNTRGITARHQYVALHVRTRAYVCARAPAIARMGISVLLVREVSTKCHVFFGLQFAEACHFETRKHQMTWSFLEIFIFYSTCFFLCLIVLISRVLEYIYLYIKPELTKALFCLFASRSRRSVILLISDYSYVLSQMQILVSAEL